MWQVASETWEAAEQVLQGCSCCHLLQFALLLLLLTVIVLTFSPAWQNFSPSEPKKKKKTLDKLINKTSGWGAACFSSSSERGTVCATCVCTCVCGAASPSLLYHPLFSLFLHCHLSASRRLLQIAFLMDAACPRETQERGEREKESDWLCKWLAQFQI